MRFLLAFLALGLLLTESRAGVVVCQFTEPFFSIRFDSVTGAVIQTSADETDPATGNPIPKTIASGAKLVRQEKWEGVHAMQLQGVGGLVLELKLTGQGSDGMSDAVYPMEGIYGRNVGGCETEKVKAYDLYQLWEDLGVPY